MWRGNNLLIWHNLFKSYDHLCSNASRMKKIKYKWSTFTNNVNEKFSIILSAAPMKTYVSLW